MPTKVELVPVTVPLDDIQVTYSVLKKFNIDTSYTLTKNLIAHASKEDTYSVLNIALLELANSDHDPVHLNALYLSSALSYLLEDISSNNYPTEYPALWEHFTTHWSVNPPERYRIRDADDRYNPQLKDRLWYTICSKGVTSIDSPTVKHYYDGREKEAVFTEDQRILERMCQDLWSHRMSFLSSAGLAEMVDQIFNRAHILKGINYTTADSIKDTWVGNITSCLDTIAQKEESSYSNSPLSLEEQKTASFEVITVLSMLTESLLEAIEWDKSSHLYILCLSPWLMTHASDDSAISKGYELCLDAATTGAYGDLVKRDFNNYRDLIRSFNEEQADTLIDTVRSGFRNSWVSIIIDTPLLEKVSHTKLRELLKKSKHRGLFGAIDKLDDIPKDIADTVAIYTQMREHIQ